MTFLKVELQSFHSDQENRMEQVGLPPYLLEKLFLELRSIKAREMKGKVSKQTHPVFFTSAPLFGLPLLSCVPPPAP